MRAHQPERGQRDVTGPECHEHVGETPRETGGRDSFVGYMLGQVQHARAVDEELRTALTEVQPPRVDFGEKLDQVRCRGTLGRNGTAQLD
jgi:hypothetical protein